MAYGKAALGKIFISYSSGDRQWVRRFEKRLQDAGYETWRDEKEIEIGDAIAAKISEGIRDAKIVVVVVSAASLASKWLRYELDIATERMVKGACRVVPVLIDEVDVPSELAGRLYADMRPKRRGGFAKLVRVLDAEAARYPAPAAPLTMDSPDAWIRRQAYEKFLGKLADGGWFSADMEISATRNVSFEGMTIGDRDVIVDVVSIYSLRGELTIRDFDDWVTRVGEELNETCGLLITEKPPSDDLVAKLNLDDRIGQQTTSGIFQPSGALVLADLSEDMSDAHARDVLIRAHQVLKNAIDTAEPPLMDPNTLPRSAN